MSMFPFVSRKTYEKALTDLKAEAARNIEPLVRERDSLQQLAKGLDEEFCKAVRERDSWEQAATKYAEELTALKADFNQRLADAVQDYQADALKWRKARSSRANARNTPTRPSRAKSADKGKKGVGNV